MTSYAAHIESTHLKLKEGLHGSSGNGDIGQMRIAGLRHGLSCL